MLNGRPAEKNVAYSNMQLDEACENNKSCSMQNQNPQWSLQKKFERIIFIPAELFTRYACRVLTKNSEQQTRNRLHPVICVDVVNVPAGMAESSFSEKYFAK